MFDIPLMNVRQMFSSAVSRAFLKKTKNPPKNILNRHQIPAQVQQGGGGERESGWVGGGVEAHHSLSLSLSLSLAALPSLLRILYRAIRPRWGPDKQEPLDWKQL